jgi:hypothetical protein
MFISLEWNTMQDIDLGYIYRLLVSKVIVFLSRDENQGEAINRSETINTVEFLICWD